MRYCISNIQPDPNKYTIVTHGLPTKIAIPDANGAFSNHEPAELLRAVTAANNYGGEEHVVINACNTGRIGNGFAQQISGSPPFQGAFVTAPNDVVWGLGQHIGPPRQVADSANNLPVPGRPQEYDPTRPGQWNGWINGGEWRGNRYQAVPPPPPPRPPPPPPGHTLPPITQRMNNGLPFQNPAGNPPNGGDGTGGGST